MNKYVILVAGLTTASAFANDRDPASIGGRLGDGAFMKATGMSPVEWAAQCGRSESASKTAPYVETGRLMPGETPVFTETIANDRDPGSIGRRLGDGAFMKATGMSPLEWAAQSGRLENAPKATPYRSYSYSETERLMPEQTPVSTETIQGETGTVASSANIKNSTSAGPGTSANYSATANDTTPSDGDSLADHHLAVGSSAEASTGRDVSSSYQQDHSAIYTDKNDTATGAPATIDRGAGSSDSLNSSSRDTQSGSFDAAWTTQIKSELTAETPDNTGASSFTSASLQNVDITQSNGTVMLKGTVPTEQMKRDLERRVKELSPGSTVNNQLSVAPSADLPANGSSTPRD